MAKNNRGPDKTLHVDVENRKRLSTFGVHGDTWNDIVGKVLDIAERYRSDISQE